MKPAWLSSTVWVFIARIRSAVGGSSLPQAVSMKTQTAARQTKRAPTTRIGDDIDFLCNRLFGFISLPW
jgi:hypothetical protein